MYYIKQVGNEFVKYSVQLDMRKLIDLQSKIRENCGDIIHVCIKDVTIRDDMQYIRGLKSQFVSVIEKECSSDEKLYQYEYEYDYITEPEMCKMITRLLNNDVSMIAQLENYIPVKNPRLEYYESLDSEIQKELSKPIGDRDLHKIQIIVEEMEEYKRYLKNNAGRKSERNYKEKVLSCIHVTNVACISAIDLSLACEFMQDVPSFDIASFTKVKQ